MVPSHHSHPKGARFESLAHASLVDMGDFQAMDIGDYRGCVGMYIYLCIYIYIQIYIYTYCLCTVYVGDDMLLFVKIDDGGVYTI